MEHSRFGVTWRWHQQPQLGFGGTFLIDFFCFGRGGGGWAGIAAVVMRRWRAEAASSALAQRLAPQEVLYLCRVRYLAHQDGATPHVHQYGKNMIKHVLKHPSRRLLLRPEAERLHNAERDLVEPEVVHHRRKNQHRQEEPYEEGGQLPHVVARGV